MKLALDLDGTISAHPEFFAFMAQGWSLAGGEVHFVTARQQRDRAITKNAVKPLPSGVGI